MDIEGVKASADIVSVIGSFVALKQRGQEYLARCPFHSPDAHPSFYVIPGKRMYHCFACGASGDVIDFLREHQGLTLPQALERLNGGAPEWKPLPIEQEAKPKPPRVTLKPPADAGVPDMRTRALGEPSATWCYRDTDGGVLGYVARYETPQGKEIRCWTWGARGQDGPAWGCGQWNVPRPLYGLDRLGANPDRNVLLVAGEKAADAAQATFPEYNVLTWPGGAQAWHRADWSALRGRKVLLWPDNDEPGKKAMRDIAGVIGDQRGLGCTGKIVEIAPDDAPEGWDIADAVAEGWTRAQLVAWVKPKAVSIAPQQTNTQNPAPQPEAAEESPPSADSAPGPSPDAPTLPAPIGTAVVAGPLPESVEISTPETVTVEFPTPPQEGPQAPASDSPPLSAYEADPAAKPAKSRPRKAKTDRPRFEVVGNAARAPEPESAPEPVEPVSMSEDAIADVFAEELERDWRYVPAWGHWMHWDGDGWRRDQKELIDRVAVEMCRRASTWTEALTLSPDGKRKLGQRRTAGNVRDLARNDRRIATSPDGWDCDPLLLGIPGGVFDIRTGKVLDSEREQYITLCTAVAPASGEPQRWLSHLHRMMAGDKSMIDFLQLFAGYCATGDVSEQCFLFLYGMGQTGKGTFLLTLAELLGTYARASSASTFMSTDKEKHSSEIARLAGARLVVIDETDATARWNEERIKRMTGGGRITAARKYHDEEDIPVTWKLAFAGNHKPALRGVGKEMERRIRLVKCNESIPDEDIDRKFRERMIAEEGPQILNWILQGALRWHESGLPLPEGISDATRDYLESEDVIGEWLSECCEQRGETLRTSAYKNYAAWAERRGDRAWSNRAWWAAMEDRGFRTRKTGGAHWVVGLTLKDTSGSSGSGEPASQQARQYQQD